MILTQFKFSRPTGYHVITEIAFKEYFIHRCTKPANVLTYVDGFRPEAVKFSIKRPQFDLREIYAGLSCELCTEVMD